MPTTTTSSSTPPSPTPHSSANEEKNNQKQQKQQPPPLPIHYRITGRAAHDRLVPLLPSHWIDVTTTSSCCPSSTTQQNNNNNNNSSNPKIDFLWENTPLLQTKNYRDDVKCYSHLPNGSSLLDDKWALSLLLPVEDEDEVRQRKKDENDCHVLETRRFRGIDGFREFCHDVGLSPDDDGDGDGDDDDESSLNSTETPKNNNSYDPLPDLLQPNTHYPTNNTPPIYPPPPPNTWVIKDTHSNGAGGIWFLSPSSPSPSHHLHPDHKYIAQLYAWPPVLYNRRKCHVRVYALLTSDRRAFVHKRAFLHVANETFDDCKNKGCVFEESVHLTNCCANSHDEEKFAGEICVDFENDDNVSPFFDSVKRTIATVARRSLGYLKGGEGNGGFEYLGLDFMFSYHRDGTTAMMMPVAYLLEVNAPPSQDSATKLDHAEGLHNEVLTDLLRLWVYPRVLGRDERCGGWRCVYNDRNDDNDDDKTVVTNMVPSKAVLLNKIRWMLFERREEKKKKKSFQQLPSTPTSPINNTTTTPSSFSHKARMQYPYYHHPHPPIFLENAGGTQVPSSAIRAISQSLSHRHRDRRGATEKKRAAMALRAYMGGSDDDHDVFLHANATVIFETLAKGLRCWGEGDEIVLARCNHVANVTPWLRLAERTRGVIVKWWNCGTANDDGNNQETTSVSSLTFSLQQLITKRTRLVALSHASNILGICYPLDDLTRCIKRKNPQTLVIVDGVAAFPHVYPNLKCCRGVDWYVVSCHKFFSGHLGAACGRRRRRCLMPQDDDGGGEGWGVWDSGVGTVNYEACAGIWALKDYFALLAEQGDNDGSKMEKKTKINDNRRSHNHRHAIHETGEQQQQPPSERCGETDDHHHDTTIAAKEETEDDESAVFDLSSIIETAYINIKNAEMALVELLLSRLRSNTNVFIIDHKFDNSSTIKTNEHDETTSGDSSFHRLPIVSFVHSTIASDIIVSHLAKQNVICRCGTFLCHESFLEEEFGIKGDIVRFSLVHYNTKEEVEVALRTLEMMDGW